MQLAEAEPLGVLDHHHRRVGHVHPHLDHRGGHEDVNVALLEPLHRLLRLVGRELAVGKADGEVPSDQTEQTMQRFKAGEIDILVATTVIEVGVDVPTATVMLIEHAERFGLSQLHQLRGRVGRSEQQSYCILMAGYKKSAEAKERLQAMVRTNDGFEISETDLQIRGAGDFFGTRQSGMPDLKIADITEDTEILEDAREAAFALVGRDPHLRADNHERLRRRYEDSYAEHGLGFARVG